MLLSIVVPCYNEQEALPYFYKEICRVAEEMKASHGADFEFIFVDDGSKDNTLAIARQLHGQDARVRYISFSRNFGKEAGILAGLEAAKGDYVAMMDADLQDPPALLPQMLDALLNEDYDCAATRRTDRKGEPPIRSFFARMFYKIINKMSDADIVDGARDYRLMRRRMVDAILALPEYNRFSKGIFGWVGFKTKWLEYVNVERVAGETKWSFWKLFLYSLEGLHHRASGAGQPDGHRLLRAGFCDDRFHHRAHPALRRPHQRLAQPCVHHLSVQRRAAVLHGGAGAVSGQDLYGSETPPGVHRAGDRSGRRSVNRPF